jgi:hypothetical protein
MEKLKQNGYITLVNKPNGVLSGTSYPKHRPLQIYRRQGKTSDNLVDLADTYWSFNNVTIHVIFGSFWYEGYGYVALRRDPTSFEMNGFTFLFVSNSGGQVVWRNTSTNETVVWSSLSENNTPCEPRPSYVKQYKMLGKTREANTAPANCCPNTKLQGSIGSISSFSGRAQIRPASTLTSPTYYSDTSQYLRSRGESFHVNQVLSKIPGVVYYEGDKVIWPITQQTVDGEVLNSSIFQSCGTVNLPSCGTAKDYNRTIYKPSNSKYAKQGAVSSAERVVRLRTENPVVRTSMTGKKIL